MPRQILLSRIPVDLSVIEFDLDEEELFLSYTWDRRFGPGITRDGIGPPKMDSPLPGVTRPITNATALRTGTWLLREDLLEREIASARTELEDLRKNPALNDEADTVAQAIEELEAWRSDPGVHAHDTAFARRYPEYDIVAQQGCGDLTMNSWCVAYVNNKLAESKPELVRLHSEKIEYRTYSCLVKWKPSAAGVRRMTIEDVVFSQAPEAAVKGFSRNQWLPRGKEIDFAVSNQQVIRDGAKVPVVETCRQFGDLRHLLQLPNLNPNQRISPHDVQGPDGSFRPRPYKWMTAASNDIWLAEEALLPQPHTGENLLRTALTGPVILDFPADRNEVSLRGALTAANYTEVLSDLEPLRPGEWRFVRRDTAELFLEIFFRRNTYGLTMIGLTPDGRKLLWLACTGFPAQLMGYTIEEAAEILLDAGAWNALLVDEGFDAMQEVRWNGSAKFESMIPRKRGRIRAAFIVGKRRGE